MHASQPLPSALQYGEDGVIFHILRNIGATDRYYVEFGTQNGSETNTRALRELLGWTGLLMDGGFQDARINLHKEWISPETINQLFEKHKVPKGSFDLLSIGNT